MKTIRLSPRRVERIIATFGRARLIRHFDGHLEVRYGSPSERQDAREWVSLFMQEAVVHRH